MRPPLALTGAEGCRAVLTVDQGPVWEGSGPGAPDLRGKGHMNQARSSQLTLRLPPAQVPNLGLPHLPPTSQQAQLLDLKNRGHANHL
ncbi:hypothetical protein D623_10006444 [Myotis brandtii]|uniref:Uncharacterized protein n=1 Tax=Myotis brandtii TaxID=109478 RepID=S7PA56_MYOBR|nr:hypothetical protein D623_10006444 [Myotis brandtii]